METNSSLVLMRQSWHTLFELMKQDAVLPLIIFLVLIFCLYFKSRSQTKLATLNRRKTSKSDSADYSMNSGEYLRQEAGKPKTILLWTELNLPGFSALPRELQCGSYQCTFTRDRSSLGDSHAVVFQHKLVDELPPTRFPWQRWVLVSHESAEHEPRVDFRLRSTINWTSTYHRSADVRFPFGFRWQKKSSRRSRDLKVSWSAGQS